MASLLSSPSPREVRLSDLLSLSVPVEWHEAVAVVRQVGVRTAAAPARSQTSGHPDHVTGSRFDAGAADGSSLQWPPPAEDVAAIACVDTTHGVPEPAGIWLASDGTLRLEATVAAPGEAVARLSALLHALLPASSPPDLHLLVASTNADERKTSVEEFLNALTFFARPDDKREISGLATRAIAAREEAGRADALHALTERARQPRLPDPPTAAPSRKSLTTRRLPLIAGGVVAVLVLAFSAWALVGRSASLPADTAAAPAATAGLAQRVQQGVASATAFVKETLQGVPQASQGRGADLELPRAARGHAVRRQSDTSVRNADAIPAAAATTPVAALEGPEEGGMLPPRDLPSLDGMQHVLAAAPHGVYSAAHPDVIPPALVRAQMPEVPLGGLPIERPGVLELVVDERGQVLSAKLMPVSNRHQDRMMVSAAKAWRFTPATRNGEPVQYRLQMPITW